MMIRLALISSAGIANRYQRLSPRLRGARFTTLECAVPESPSPPSPPAIASLAGLIDRRSSDFDAVVFHVPSTCLPDLARAAVTAGKHLLVNGPLASSIRQAAGLIAILDNAPTLSMIGKPWRHLPAVRTLKENLAAGKLGSPGLLRMHLWQTAHPGLPLLDRILPGLDIAHWLFDSRPGHVFTLSQPHGQCPPDYLQVHLGFPDDGMALIDFAWSLPEGGDYNSLSVIGSAGAAYADDHHNMNLLFNGGPPSAIAPGCSDAHLLAQLQDFVDALQGPPSQGCVGENGMSAHQLAEAVLTGINASQPLNLAGDRYELT